MPKSLDLSFHLFQVLEEEHISLYGYLEQVTEISLRGRKVTSEPNWDFHEGHIRNWEGFKRYLQEPHLDLPGNLKKYLTEENFLNWGDEDQVRASLNRILARQIYDWRDCMQINLRETTEKLFELYEENGNQSSLDELKWLNRFLLEDLFPKYLEKVSDIRLTAIYQRRHERKPAALCLSGGGIRSATFALGLLQGLARQNLLTQFDYLSTVSGGGYIGAWLTAWIHRNPGPQRGLPGVTSDLTNVRPGSKIDPEPPTIRYLRENSNFLTPQVGLMSADTWTFLAIYVRNLLLNWSVLIPLFVAVLLIPRFAVAAVLAQPSKPIRFTVLFLGFASASWAIAYIVLSRPGLRTKLIEATPALRERMGQRGFLKFCLLPLVIAAISLTSYWAWTPDEKSWWRFLLFGLAASIAGLMASWPVLRMKVRLTSHFYITALFGAASLVGYWRWTPKAVWWHFLLIAGAVALVGWLVSVIARGTWRESRVIAAALLLFAGAIGGLIARAATVLTPGELLVSWDVDKSWATELYVSYAVPFFLLLFMLALTVFAGISSHFLSKITEEDREWWARFSGWALIAALAWAVFSTLVIFGPLALLAAPKMVGAVGGVSGLIALLLGQSGKTPATSEQVAQGGLKTHIVSGLLPFLAIVFIVVFIAGLSLLTSKLFLPVTAAVDDIVCIATPNCKPKDPALISAGGPLSVRVEAQTGPGNRLTIPVRIGDTKVGEFSPTQIVGPSPLSNTQSIEHMRAIHYPRWWLVAGVMLLLLGFGLLMARVINLNLFSLHNSYRSRLIRGFLAASREEGIRQPNPFTGFDPADNVPMHALRPALLHEVDFKEFEYLADQFKSAGKALKERGTSETATASEFIFTQLSEKVRTELDEKDEETPPSQTLRTNLIEDLNRILEDEKIDLSAKQGFVKPSPAQVSTTTPAQQVTTTPRQEATTTPVQRATTTLVQRATTTPVQQTTPPEQGANKPAASPQLQLEYHIHRNRRTLELTYPQFIEESDYPPHRLLHVLNTTLNLVGGDILAWQQRKAEPFTISPLHCGSYRVGYRRSKDYGGDDGISLGTAMAISGAAASSNMGYYTTSPVLSLVLTIFNVRLGWWLGNPGPAGSQSYRGLKSDESPDASSKKIYRRMSPTLSVLPLIYEAFGLTDDRSKYVHLTDGGHFENLALYEMVLRRCSLIVVSDGAADSKYSFNDLANAVRKIRIDLGVPIEFPDVPIYADSPTKSGEGGSYWAVGLIRYSQIDRLSDGGHAKDGILIYIKPAVYGDEPEDVIHYKRTHPAFPNETTADQFFDEPQFESYRALGSFIMDQMCGSHSGDLTKLKFVIQVIANLVRVAPQMREKYRDFWIDYTRTDQQTSE
ncbi:MAG TPA: patatin-like phospholipase family protein [Pyrinomonadaceae bacterium]|nr:patatin-like phospholipase family protein [Pyrinomonadaceae bacterium]